MVFPTVAPPAYPWYKDYQQPPVIPSTPNLSPQEQAAYQSIWNTQASNYWLDPGRLNRYYTAIMTIADKTQIPEWVNADAIQTAYKYLQYKNNNKPWYEWVMPDSTDPTVQMLSQLAAPPNDKLLPYEAIQKAAEAQVGPLTAAATNFADLPKWQQAYISLMAPQTAATLENRPVGSRISAAAVQSLMGVIGGAGLGASIGGPVGAAIGAVILGGLSFYQNFTGKQIPVISQILGAFNLPAEGLERLIGTVDQAAYEGVDSILQDLPSAWKAGHETYETLKPDLINWFAKTYNAATGQAAPELANENQIWKITEGFIHPQALAHPELQGEVALRDLRQMLDQGADKEQAYAEIASRFGDSGTVNNFVGQVLLDPMQLMPYLTGKLGELGAWMLDKPELAVAFKASTGSPFIDMLPLGIQQIATAITGVQGSQGIISTLRQYRGVVQKIGLKNLETGGYQTFDEMSWFDKTIGGITKEGQVAELQPTPVKATFIQKLRSLTPEAKAAIYLDNMMSGTGQLSWAVDDPSLPNADRAGALMTMLQKYAEPSTVEVGDAGEALLRSPMTATTSAAIKAFVGSNEFQETFANWMNDGMQSTISKLNNAATFLGVSPADLVDQLVDDPAGVASKLQTAKTGDLQALADPDTLQNTFAVFTGKRADGIEIDPQAFDFRDFRARALNQMNDSATDYLITHFGIKENSAVIKLAGLLKSVQSTVFLDLNPAYLINNTLNDEVTRAAQGTGGFLTPGQVEEWWDRFGPRPARLAEGFGSSGGEQVSGEIPYSTYINQFIAVQRGDGSITKLTRMINSARSKFGLFSQLSGRVEGGESIQAYTIGTQEAWRRLWKPGAGYSPMDATLVSKLTEIDPNLPDRVYRIINSGMSGPEIDDALWNNPHGLEIQQLLGRVAEEISPANADVTVQMFDKTGVSNALQRELRGATTPEEVDAAFTKIRSSFEDDISNRLNEDVATVREETSNRIKAEGALAVPDMFADAQDRIWQRWMEHYKNTSDAAVTILNLPLEERGAAWTKVNTSEAKAWQAAFDTELETYAGASDQLGGGGEAAQTTLHLLRENIQSLSDYFNGYDIHSDTDARYGANDVGPKTHVEGKNELYNKFFAGGLDPETTFEDVERMANQRFEALTKQMTDTRHQIDDLMISQYTDPEQKTAVTKWRTAVAAVQDKMDLARTTFRDALTATQPGSPERNKAWTQFLNKTYLPLITELKTAEIQGAQNLLPATQLLDTIPTARLKGVNVSTGGDPKDNIFRIGDASTFVTAKGATTVVGIRGAAKGDVISSMGIEAGGEHETMLYIAGYDTSEIDNTVRFTAEADGVLGTSIYNAGSFAEGEDPYIAGMNNIYKALDILAKKGLPEDTPINVWQHGGSEEEADLPPIIIHSPANLEGAAAQTTPELMSADKMRNLLITEGGLTEAEADTYMVVQDGYAHHWARKTGKTVEDYYASQIGGVTHGGEATGLHQDWYYSVLAKAVNDLPQEPITVGRFRSLLGKTQGLTVDELESTGMDEFLNSHKDTDVITKDELGTYMNDHAVTVDVKQLGGSQTLDKLLKDWNDAETSIHADRMTGTIPDSATATAARLAYDTARLGPDLANLLQTVQPGMVNSNGVVVDMVRTTVAGMPSIYKPAMILKEQLDAMPPAPITSARMKLEGDYQLAVQQADTIAKQIFTDAQQYLQSGTLEDYSTLGNHIDEIPDTFKQSESPYAQYTKGTNPRDLLFYTPAAEGYTSPHYNDAGKGLLGQVRMEDMVDAATGERVLHILELQSDLQQAAAKYGTFDPNQTYTEADLPEGKHLKLFPDAFQVTDPTTGKVTLGLEAVDAAEGAGWKARLYGRTWTAPDGTTYPVPPQARSATLTDILKEAGWQPETVTGYTVADPSEEHINGIWQTPVEAVQAEMKTLPPEVPFQDTWGKLFMKKVINYASANGYNKVVFTTGEQQYNLWGSPQYTWTKATPTLTGVSYQILLNGARVGLAFDTPTTAVAGLRDIMERNGYTLAQSPGIGGPEVWQFLDKDQVPISTAPTESDAIRAAAQKLGFTFEAMPGTGTAPGAVSLMDPDGNIMYTGNTVREAAQSMMDGLGWRVDQNQDGTYRLVGTDEEARTLIDNAPTVDGALTLGLKALDFKVVETPVPTGEAPIYMLTGNPQTGGNFGSQEGLALPVNDLASVQKAVAAFEATGFFRQLPPDAEKIWARIQESPDGGEYLPRKIGQETFYDEKMVKDINKFLKPYGTQIEDTDIMPPQLANQPNTENLTPAPSLPYDFEHYRYWQATGTTEEAIYQEIKSPDQVVPGRMLYRDTRPSTTEHGFTLTDELKKATPPLFQGTQGSTDWGEDGKATLHFMEGANVSTVLHEGAHVWLHTLATSGMTDDVAVVTTWLRDTYKMKLPDDWAAAPDPTDYADAHEKFARATERYFRTGKAPAGAGAKIVAAFQNFKSWLKEIYARISGSAIDVKITPELKELMDSWMVESDPALTDIHKSPTSLMTGDTLTDGYQSYMKPVLDTLQARIKDSLASNPSAVGATLPEQTAEDLQTYLQKVYKADMPGAKAAALNYGEMQRDAALLNYHKRYGFDTALGLVFPYQFWYTRSMINWGLRMIDKPGWYSFYAHVRDLQQSYKKKGIPSRLQGKVKLLAPWLPSWAGGMSYLDPLKQLFPFDQLAQPLSNYNYAVSNQVYSAKDILKQMVTDGKITQQVADTAIQTQTGDAWNTAMQQANQESDQNLNNPATMVGMMMTPAMYLTMPYYALTGQMNKISPTPPAKTAAGIQAVTKGTPLETIGSIVGALAKPEQWLRSKVGISQFGEFGDYYVDRALAAMAGDGTASATDVEQAMIQRSGPVYDAAVQRTQYEQGLKSPGVGVVAVIAQALKGNATVGNVLTESAAALFPQGLWSVGEMKESGEYDAYMRAWKLYDAGDTKAVQKFFDDHPEYEARIMQYKDPDQRLRNFLIGQIWDGYHALSGPNKTQILDTLGETFVRNVLDKTTADTSSVDIQTLAYWAQLLGGMVPSTTETQPVLGRPIYQQEVPQLFSTAVNQAVIDYRAERDKLYPNITTIQSMYYNVPTGANGNKNILIMFPQLKEYWAWNKAYKASHPLVDQYEKYQAQQYGTTTTETNQVTIADLSQFDGALMRQLFGLVYAGQPLSDGARAELYRLWLASGMPNGTFPAYLAAIKLLVQQ